MGSEMCIRDRCCYCTNSGACPVWPVLFGALQAVAVVTRTLLRAIIVERVCVFKNYVFREAKVYRVLAVNGLQTPH